MSPNSALEAVRGRIDPVQSKTWKGGNLPSNPTGTPERLPAGCEIHPDVLALFSNAVLHASTANSRNLQESACADGTSSIDVASTVFPLLESCMIPIEVDGQVSYGSRTGYIIYMEETTSTDVSI